MAYKPFIDKNINYDIPRLDRARYEVAKNLFSEKNISLLNFRTLN